MAPEIRSFLQSWIAERVQRPATGEATFAELGLDSFDIIGLADALSEQLDEPVSVLTVIDHPSIDALMAHLSPAAAPDEPSRGQEIAAFLCAWASERLEREVSPDATFAEAGLDSFDIIGLADAVREHLGDESISILTVIEHPSIAALAAHLAGSDEPETEAPLPLVSTGVRTGEVLSYWQEAVLAWEAAREPSSTWASSVRLRMAGPLDLSRLEEAVQRLLERQDALRQVFVRGRTTAELCSSSAIGLNVVDLEGQPEQAREEAYHRIAMAPVPLDGSPLVAFHVLSRGPTDHTLVVSWHQLVHDATEGHLLVHEVLEIYAALTEGRPHTLPELPLSYGDYAAWEKAYFDGPGAAQVREARERIAGARPLALPRREGPTARAGGAQQRIQADETLPFLAMCRAEGVTFFTGVTALAAVLAAFSYDQDEIVLACPVSTRTRPEVRSLAGRFGAWVPLRVSLEGDPTVREVMAQVASQAKLLLQPVPGPLLFERTDVFEHPLMRFVVNVPSAGGAGDMAYVSPVEGLDVTYQLPVRSMVSPPALALLVIQAPQLIFCRAIGQLDYLDEATLHRHMESFERLLHGVGPAMRVSELWRREAT